MPLFIHCALFTLEGACIVPQIRTWETVTLLRHETKSNMIGYTLHILFDPTTRTDEQRLAPERTGPSSPGFTTRHGSELAYSRMLSPGAPAGSIVRHGPLSLLFLRSGISQQRTA